MQAPSQISTLRPSQRRIALNLAVDMIQSGKQPIDALIQYGEGILLIEPVNGVAAYTVDLRNGTACYFHSTPGSGTDRIRQRAHAQLWYEGLVASANESGLPFFPIASCVPKHLKFDDLPIQLDEWRIGQVSKPFKNRRNPISGHEWSEPAGYLQKCKVEGPSATVDLTFGTVAAAVEHVQYLIRTGATRGQHFTDAEWDAVQQQDVEVTRAEQRRSRPRVSG